MIKLKPDKQPIGKFEKRKPFTNHIIRMNQGDEVYLFSDGYADQFGGPTGKKFMYKRMEQLLVSMNDKDIQSRKEILENAFEEWRGVQEQVDDICFIGLVI